MRDILKRGLTVALAAVLLFTALVPVPVGNRLVDGVTHERAQAFAPAVAVAGTVLTAAGVYVAGVTLAEYDGKLDEVGNAFVSWCASNLYHDDIDAAAAAMSGALDAAGNVDMGKLAQAGIVGAVPGFAASLVAEGKAKEAATSYVEGVKAYSLENNTYAVSGDYPYQAELAERNDYQQLVEAGYKTLAFIEVGAWANGVTNYHYIHVGENTRYISRGSYIELQHAAWVTYTPASKGSSVNLDKTVRLCPTGTKNNSINSYYATTDDVVYGSFDLTAALGGVQEVTQPSPYSATVAEGVLDGTYEAPTEGVYQQFYPTAEQLSAGYDSTAVLEAEIAQTNATLSDVIARINAQAAQMEALRGEVGTIGADVGATAADVDAIAAAVQLFPGILDGILDAVSPLNGGIGGILAALNPLAGILEAVTAILGVLTGLQASPFDWLAGWWGTLSGWWSGLLDWLGETPFGQAIGGVVSAVNAGVGTLAGAAAGVVDAVREGVGALAGAVEGVASGTLTLAPASVGTGSGVGLASGVRAEFDATVRQKAPFCYVLRAQAVGERMAARFGSVRSFYVDVPMPLGMEPLRFDAGPALNQSWGGNTVAGYMRVLLTSVLGAGLVALAVRVAMRTLGSGGD